MYFEDTIHEKKYLKEDIEYCLNTIKKYGTRTLAQDKFVFDKYYLRLRDDAIEVFYKDDNLPLADSIQRQKIIWFYNVEKKPTNINFFLSNPDLADNMVRFFNSIKLEKKLDKLLNSNKEFKKTLKV
jgi:hypothetical protein